MKTLVLAALAAAVLAVPVLAGGQRTITVPVSHVGDVFQGGGCGYRSDIDIIVYLYPEGSTAQLVGLATHAGADGCFAFTTGYLFTTAGGYEVETFQVKGSAGPGSYNQNHPAGYLDFDVLP